MGTLEDRLDALIKKLVGHRALALDNYMTALESYDPHEGSMPAVERAGILHDLDKHITNLELEHKRVETQKQMNGVAHA